MKVFDADAWPGHRHELADRVLRLDRRYFTEVALEVFRYQACYNPVYRSYISLLGTAPDRVEKLTDVPFLPIRLFKNHVIRTGAPGEPAAVFESSGTTGKETSRHFLFDPGLYHSLSTLIFQDHFGSPDQYHILALLPSYLERNNSSLVYMVQHFIEQTGSAYSGFYLHNYGELTARLRELARKGDGRRVLVLGVTFALLDWAESGEDFSFLGDLEQLTIMETGGMKGRRSELLREEVHRILGQRFGVQAVSSEYGMTELISQAYAPAEGEFIATRTLKVLLRDPNDPFDVREYEGKPFRGGINVVDLGNLDSCAFIETQDLGTFGGAADRFRVIGRFDNSDLRGCNLMVL